MSSPSPERALTSGDLGRMVLLAGLYLLSGRLGLALAHYQDNATLFWPPTGLALAALILYGRRLWPGVFLGALAVCAWTGLAPLPAAAIAAGNTLEAFVGAFLLERVARFRPDLERVRDVVSFLFYGALGCTVISATIGVATLELSGNATRHDLPLVWMIWWLGDVEGALVVAPVLLLARHGSPPWGALIRRRETWLVLVLLLGTSLLAFGGPASGFWAQVLAFVPFPFLVWAGGRLGPRGAVSASLCIALVAVTGTAYERGPFALEDLQAGRVLLWAYVTTMGMAALLLAAAIAERELAESRRRAEEDSRLELERRMHQAQRLDSLGLLAGGIAHDFNNILTAIRGNTELLGLRDGLDGEVRERLRQIELASDRAADLCRRLLAYAGRRRTEKKTLALNELIGETCELVQPSLRGRATLGVDLGADTPPIEGDPTLLRQVVMNLLLNAAEAMGEREGRVRVSSGAAELTASELGHLIGASEAAPGRFAYVEVSDTGAGMDAATLERIFDPFYSTKVDGRGLGLATALGIVKSHAGALDVQSAPGEGSRFRVYLPAAQGAPTQESASTWMRRTRGRERQVLVVDDEPAVLEVVTRTLEAAGYKTLQASDGERALELHRQHGAQIDAFLLDVTMPGRSGVDVMVELRRRGAKQPVVLMSGYEPRDSAPGVEPEAFVRKPFAGRDLLDQLGRVLAASR